MISKIVIGDSMSFTRLKERRIYEGYTQKEIAELLNVKRATYAGWETGKDIIPLKRLFALSNKYNISLDYLTNLTNDDNKFISKNNKINLKNVSSNLRKVRLEHNITQKEVAKDINTTQSNIHKYETGKTLITTMYAIEFSKKYHYSLDKLLNRK